MAAAVKAFTEAEVREGLPVTAVSQLAYALDRPVIELLGWLQISPRTWARRRQTGVLDPLESDRVARLARLWRRAVAVVGGTAQARAWLTTPQRALGRRPPLDVAATEVGAEEVFHLLGRLDYGVFG